MSRIQLDPTANDRCLIITGSLQPYLTKVPEEVAYEHEERWQQVTHQTMEAALSDNFSTP